MKNITLFALATATLTLSACSDFAEDAGFDEAGTAADAAPKAMTEEEKKQAKNQCEISAIVQGGSNEQAKALCDCTIESLAVGRSGEELEVLDGKTANEALNTCAADLGIG